SALGTDRITDRPIRPREEKVPSFSRYAFDGRRQRNVLLLKLSKLGFRVGIVEINDEYAGLLAGRYTDIAFRIPAPRAGDYVGIDGSVVESVCTRRPFIARPARENTQAARSICERGIQQRAHNSSRHRFEDVRQICSCSWP